MKANQITAIATSVISVILLGFVFDLIYNSEKNVRARCLQKYIMENINGRVGSFPEDKKRFMATCEERK